MERWLFELDPEVRGQCVVHGHDDLIVGLGLAGSHGLSVETSRSASLHSFDELNACTQNLDYVFLSPVFDSISKVDYKAAYSQDDFRKGLADFHAQERSIAKVIALGGVDADNLVLTAQLGFDGAAVLGAVWNHYDPLATWDSLYQATCAIRGVKATNFGPIESWRDELVKRRGNTW